MLHYQVGPSEDSPFYFTVTISGQSTFEDVTSGADFHAFLHLSIASGDWSGILFTVHTPCNEVEVEGCMHGKVTWDDFLKRLYLEQPTSTNYDDFEPLIGGEKYCEYYKIGISLLFGAG